MDETGVQLDHKPGKVLAAKGARYLQARTSGNRETITVIVAINAAGGSLAPHVIVKGKTRRSLQSLKPTVHPLGKPGVGRTLGGRNKVLPLAKKDPTSNFGWTRFA